MLAPDNSFILPFGRQISNIEYVHLAKIRNIPAYGRIDRFDVR